MKGEPTRGRRRLQMLQDLTKDDVCAAVRQAAEDGKRWRYSGTIQYNIRLLKRLTKVQK